LGRGLVALTLTLGSAPQRARADEGAASIRMAARELAVSGADAYDKADYATALDRFQRAESLYKAPSIAVMVARCLARVGRLVEAVDKYEETLRMPLDASAPEAFQRAVAEAKGEVEAARARVARLELRLPSEVPVGAEVRLDGRTVPPALLGVAIPVNPGTHHVVAQVGDRPPTNYDLSLAEGVHQSVQIAFASAAPDSPVVLAPPAPTLEAERKSPTLAIALLTGGGIALAAGTVTGIAALGHKSDLDKQCTPGCPTNMSSDLKAFRLDRTLSYVGFGVGLAAVGVGTYFLLHRDSSGSQVGALVLPGGAALTGTF
jgi:tetratricopeptide (TPR) repeat protein